MLKVNNRKTRRRCEISSKLSASVFIVNFEHISLFFQVSVFNFQQVNAGWEAN